MTNSSRRILWISLFLAITSCRHSNSVLSENEIPLEQPTSIFAEASVLRLELTLPLNQILIPNYREESNQYKDGSLKLGTKVFPLKVRQRGNTSWRRCKFPKLEIKFDKETAKNTEFENQREIKLLTHCDPRSPDEVLSFQIEQAKYEGLEPPTKPSSLSPTGNHKPHVEAFIYSLYTLVSNYAFQSRSVLLTIKDSEGSEPELKDRPNALVEDPEYLAKRLDLIYIDNTEWRRLNPTFDETQMRIWYDSFDKSQIVKTVLFNVLIDNRDFFIHTQGQNVRFFRTKGDNFSIIPIPYDFDAASAVNDFVRSSLLEFENPESFIKSLKRALKNEILGYLEERRSLPDNELIRPALYNKELLMEGIEIFKAKKEIISNHIEGSTLSGEDKEIIRFSYGIFYEVLDEISL